MGCRKFKGEAFYDDLTGQTHLPEELEEISFIFDGQALVIHLDEDNAEAFRLAMQPYVDAAQETSKAKVLRTLPKRRRHLRAVETPSDDSGTEDVPQNAPETPKGESVEARTEPEGPQVPETPSDVSDSRSDEPPKPALSLVRPPSQVDAERWQAWAPWAPVPKESRQEQIAKVRQWGTAMGSVMGANEPLSMKLFKEWEDFYREKRWRHME